MSTLNGPSSTADPGRLPRLATSASMAVALILIAMKGAAWAITDSLSLLTSLADSLFDVFASAINFLAVRYAMKPPDDDHRFGHTSAEDIAALAQSAFIAGSAAFISIQAVGRLVSPEPIYASPISIVLMVVSLVLTTALVIFQQLVVRKTNSSVVKADALHYVTDILTTLAVLAALALTWWKEWPWIDPALALLISAYVFLSSWNVGKAGFDHLMNKEMSDEQRKLIETIICGHAEVKGVHDMKTRHAGPKAFIQFHLELDGNMTLFRAHEISEELEAELLKHFPTADIIIHEDPGELYDR
ncbi:MAG: cation diffusion facilitator family transporter [Alphaproteobacteria bacterium]|nr:cation diffusion facilitator family transporter [Alphaproteobacteria bacterium]